MTALKLFGVSLMTFLIAIYVLQPQLFRTGLQLSQNGGHAVHGGASEASSKLKTDYRNLLELHIPTADDSGQQWQDFISSVKLMSGSGGERPLFKYRSAATPFLAYLAKKKPVLFLQEIEAGNIHPSVFGSMLQMGLLQDWEEHTEATNLFIRSVPKALIAMAIANSDNYAKEQAKAAFLGTDTQLELFSASPRSLAFVLSSVEAQERKPILANLSNVDLSYAATSLPVLSNYLGASDYSAFIERHAGTDSWDQGHLVDLVIAGDVDAGLQLVSDYRRSRREKNFRGPGYCVVCAIAVGFEGGVGASLLEQLQEDAPSVR